MVTSVLLWAALAAAAAEPRLRVEFELESNEAYVGEQVLGTVRLLVHGDLLTSALEEPRSDGAVVRPLGQGVSSQGVRDGMQYEVVERRYAFFPVRAGELRIVAPAFSGTYAIPSTQGLPLGVRLPLGPVRNVRATAAAKTLSARPAPVRAADWLPARGVELTETLDPPTGPYTAGAAIRRVIEVVVRGQAHTSLRVPALSYAGFSAFPDAVSASTTDEAGGVVARWRRQWALVPRAEGELILPGVTIPWWDLAEGRSKVAAIAPRSITVTAQAQPAERGDAVAALPDDRELVMWRVAAALACLGWAVTVLVSRHRRAPRARIALTPDRVGEARQLLKQSLRGGDAAATRAAVIGWARLRFADAGILSLHDVIRAARSAPLARALGLLDAVLYGRGGSWDPRALRAAIEPLDRTRPSTEVASVLPPLYPGMTCPQETPPSGAPRWRVLAVLMALAGAGVALLGIRTVPPPIDADAYRAALAAQEPTVLEFLHAFEAVQDRLHPEQLPQQQRDLQAAFGERLRQLALQARSLRAPGERQAFHERWTGAVRKLDAALGDFATAGPQDFVAGFFRARRNFVDAVLELYDLRSELPVTAGYWQLPDEPEQPGVPPSVAGVPVGVHHLPGVGLHGGYSLYVPETYASDRAMPLVVALHGSHGSGRGTLVTWLRAARSVGWMVVAPKSAEASWNLERPEADLAAVQAVVRDVAQRYRFDAARVYLTGFSDGATFGYVLAARCAGSFAAFAPVSGVFPGPLDWAAARDLPVRIVHGAEDWVFPLSRAQDAYETLFASGATALTLQPVPDWGHGLNQGVNERFVLPWLRERTREKRTAPSCWPPESGSTT